MMGIYQTPHFRIPQSIDELVRASSSTTPLLEHSRPIYDWKESASIMVMEGDSIMLDSSSTKNVSTIKEPLSWFVIKVTAIASLGGCLFGYDLGSISGALPQLAITFELNNSMKEWVVSILYLGGGLGACIGGIICDYFGRKKTILGTDICFILGATILYFSNTIVDVLIGRFIVGIAIAVSGIADVSYLHEIAPIQYRGSIVSVNEACISLGFLLAYIMGYIYSSADNEEWRIIFGYAGILAIIQFIGMIPMPESPKWLAKKGYMKESQIAYEQIHYSYRKQKTTTTTTTTRIDGEEEEEENQPVIINQRTIELQENISNNNNNHTTRTTNTTRDQRNSPPNTNSSDMMMAYYEFQSTTKSTSNNDDNDEHYQQQHHNMESLYTTVIRYRQQAFIAIFLAVTQQLCGQTNVLNYAPIIFAEATNSNEPPSWSTVVIGIVKFVVTVLVIWRIEYIGRRLLLLIGMSTIAIGLFLLTIAFSQFTHTNDDDDDDYFVTTTTIPSSSSSSWRFELALPGVLMVVCGYSMSFGPLTWLITSEIFPTSIRGRALGVTTVITYLCASIVTRFFLSAQYWWGPSMVFIIYGIITIAGIIFAFLAIPDTGNKTVEDIEIDIHSMPWWRFDRMALRQFDIINITDDNNNNNNNNNKDGIVVVSPPTTTTTNTATLADSLHHQSSSYSQHQRQEEQQQSQTLQELT